MKVSNFWKNNFTQNLCTNFPTYLNENSNLEISPRNGTKLLGILKVSEFQNEFMKFLPKYQQKIVKISALTTQGTKMTSLMHFTFCYLIARSLCSSAAARWKVKRLCSFQCPKVKLVMTETTFLV